MLLEKTLLDNLVFKYNTFNILELDLTEFLIKRPGFHFLEMF